MNGRSAFARPRNVTVVTIDPGIDVCIERALSLRPGMVPVIERWYAARAA